MTNKTDNFLTEAQREEAQRQLHAAHRLLRLKKAHDSLIDYTQMSMPDPTAIDDPNASRYVVKPHHELLAEKLEAVERGEITRLVVAMPPRHGKSQLSTIQLPSWFVGRGGYRHCIIAAYNEDLAKDFGQETREVMESAFYQQVFPGVTLSRGSKAKHRLRTTTGGNLFFVGMGGTITGRGADLAIIDDPIKGPEEANSPAFRDKQWEWFSSVLLSRLMGGMARVVICMTRWHTDDLVGRLTDPKNEHYNKEEADNWDVLRIPALAEENDPLGRKEGEPLWPERTPKAFLEGQRRLNPSGFSALYQGTPTPPEGNFFKREMLKGYLPEELPANLRYYAASDHALSEGQQNDPSCMGVVGVDSNDDIYVMPDLVWRKIGSEVQVEAMLDLMRRYAPIFWWAERGHITQSIGPFLRKRMVETGTYATIVEKTPVKDKTTRAQAIQARMSMGKVYFPKFAPWWADAEHELLTFPGTHDDYIDWIAWIGIGLAELASASAPAATETPAKTGTGRWLLESSAMQRQSKEPHVPGYLH